MKKFISLFLVIISLVSMFSVFSVSAESETTVSELEKNKIYTSTDGNYQYKLAVYRKYGSGMVEEKYTSKTDIQITKYVGKKSLPKTYSIPKTIDGYTVGEIGKGAFKGKSFEKVTFHNNIQEVCDRAFYGCKKLKSIVFKKKSTYNVDRLYIDKEAFSNCSTLKSVKIDDTTREVNLKEKTFYNCPKLKTIRLNENATVYKKALGYYYDKNSKKVKRVNGFMINIFFEQAGVTLPLSNVANYAHENKFKCNGYFQDLDGKFMYLDEGESVHIYVDNKPIKSCNSSKRKIARFTSDGKLQCLQTGNAKLTIKTAKGKEIKCKIKIGNMSQIFEKNMPDIKVKDKYGNSFEFDNSKGSYKSLCARVKKGKIGKFPIVGKVNEINNVYTSSKKAKIISSPSDSTLKIKGLAKGTTTVKVKINGVKTIKLKVKVL